jgi:hypothetical protein
MDIVFVRTKLQSRIVLNLIENNQIQDNFLFIKNFWQSKNEDSKHVLLSYNDISQLAKFTYHFVEKDGVLRNSVMLWLLSIFASLTGGRFFFAGINVYSFAIARRFNPFLKIHTFDDGAANIRPTTIYYSEEPLSNNKVSNRLVNFLFPKGSAYYLRSKINVHHSIYKGKQNVVPPNKINFLDFKWNHENLNDQKIIYGLLKPKMNILIGSSMHEHAWNAMGLLERDYWGAFDLVILHPRDQSSLNRWPNAHHFETLAENLINYILSLETILELNIYHLGSSVEDAFVQNNFSNKLNFINLSNQDAKESNAQFLEKENILVFVDTIPHLHFAREIEKQFAYAKFHYITNKSTIYDQLDSSKDTFVHSKLSLLKFVKNSKNRSFSSIMAARVDDIDFQLLYKLLPPLKIYTFDEGLFTIQLDSVYNSQFKINKNIGLKYFLGSRYVNFPFPATYFYENNSKHFTSYKKENFDRSIISKDKLCFIEPAKEEREITKVFIGQPWHYMYFSEQSIINLAKFINNINPDIYLIHPREDIALIDKYLHESVLKLASKSSAEILLNRIIGNKKVNVYSVASTLLLGLNKSCSIHIINSPTFDQRIRYGQENLKETLRVEDIHFTEIFID